MTHAQMQKQKSKATFLFCEWYRAMRQSQKAQRQAFGLLVLGFSLDTKTIFFRHNAFRKESSNPSLSSSQVLCDAEEDQ